MILPKSPQNQQGQILVIFLLVLVVGLALVLSIASRTVTDIRQTTTSDETNKAYFAAESGVEKALREIEGNASFGLGCTQANVDSNVPTCVAQVNLSTANRTQAKAGVLPLTAAQNVILDYADLSFGKDDVAQVNMLADFNDINSRYTTAVPNGSIDWNDQIEFLWGDFNKTYNTDANTPAIEVSVITYDGSAWGIKKMVFDPRATRTSNKFCKAPTSATTPYEYTVTLKLDTVNSGTDCATNDVVATNNSPILIRVKFLYAAPDKFGVKSLDKALPAEGQKITSIGEAPSGVTRKIVVDRYFPALPGLFDYALFSGSSTPLCKPCP